MTSLPASASVLARPMLDAPRKPARIFGSGRFCVYLEVAGEVLAIESADGLGLPRAMRVAVPSAAGQFLQVRPGMPAFVGNGAAVAGPFTFPVRRWWQPRRVRQGTRPDRVSALSTALRDVRPAVDPAVPVAELLGHGPGLTPAGDDVLAGMLLASRADGVALTALVGDVRAAGLHRTTTLSAGLLEDAMRGHGIPAVLDLADWLAGHGSGGALPDLLDKTLAVGHSTGTALAFGLVRGGQLSDVTSKEEAA